MEDEKSEKPKAMEEAQDSASWGEWTIIQDDEEKKDVPDEPELTEEQPQEASGENTGEELPGVEEAREVIEEIDPSSLENFIDQSVSRDEDSDGISVIAESDKGESTAVESLQQKILRIAAPHLSIIAACCLAAAIGFGIGCVVGTGSTQLPPSVQMTPKTSFQGVQQPPIDISEDVSIEFESETINSPKNPVNSPKTPPFNDPSSVIPEAAARRAAILEDLMVDDDQSLNMRSFKTSLQKLKLSLDTLCSLLDDNQRLVHGDVCNKNSGIFEIIGLESTIRYLVNEFGSDEDIGMRQLIENIDFKINKMVSSFFDRLSKVMEDFRGKLYNSICLIRNTYDNGEKIQEVLDQRSISLDSCKQRSRAQNERKKKFGKREVMSGSEESVVASSEIGGTEGHENRNDRDKNGRVHNNKNERNENRKNGKSEEFKKKKQPRDDPHQKIDFKKNKWLDRDSNDNSNESSNENDFYVPETGKPRTNEAKSKKKHKQSKKSNENSAESSFESSSDEVRKEHTNGKRDFKPSKKSNENSAESSFENSSDEVTKEHKNGKRDFKPSKNSNEYSAESSLGSSSDEVRKEHKNGKRDFKPSKKYGSPKGEPKENFVERKHGNNYEATRDKENDNYCYSKKCSTNQDIGEKNRKGNGKNGQWQFERARDRGNYRSKDEDVWYNDRARARERARLGF